jgi:hypothetical protein
MTENKFELQSYFILYLLFVRILNSSKDIVSFCIFPICLFVNERHIEKYGVWPNRPYFLEKITGLVHSVQEYLNSCFARLCSFNPSDVENTSPQWHAFGIFCFQIFHFLAKNANFLIKLTFYDRK